MIGVKDVADVRENVVNEAIEREAEELEKMIMRKNTLEACSEKDKSVCEELKKINKRISKLAKGYEQEEMSFQGVERCLSEVRVSEEFVTVCQNLKVGKKHWENLLDYQQFAIEWLYGIHLRGSGGLLGDEMGLGKTVMISVFLESLKSSGLFSAPVLIICPATLIAQWRLELNHWAPSLVVFDFKSNRKSTISSIFSNTFAVLLITYEILHTEHRLLQKNKWLYLILDEGHKVKNPEAALTKLCKSFRSFHRLILTGTPIQNSLTELWSLIDFICPGLLGDIEVFDREFGSPITKAGYSSSSELQVEVAYQCALQLRQLISPYVLRRTKKDVKIGIPEHSEKIIYCELELAQWEVYCRYIENFTQKASRDTDKFVWIKDLRYICNHPAMLGEKMLGCLNADTNSTLSGKLKVLETVLEVWKEEGLSVLIFSQYKKMLNLTEKLINDCGIKYSRVDGDLEVSKRMDEINRFNSGEIQVLLLTTKVGGLGINLPKASRVLLLDPDWNPMNDSQAKERALRIGQKDHLIIYRFITKHTIEEKIYNRQIFKLFLANKVTSKQILTNPDQKKFFRNKEMTGLFESPPRPESYETIDTECIPQKRRRENKMIEMIMAQEVKEYSDEAVLQNSDTCRMGEIVRIKAHARE